MQDDDFSRQSSVDVHTDSSVDAHNVIGGDQHIGKEQINVGGNMSQTHGDIVAGDKVIITSPSKESSDEPRTAKYAWRGAILVGILTLVGVLINSVIGPIIVSKVNSSPGGQDRTNPRLYPSPSYIATVRAFVPEVSSPPSSEARPIPREYGSYAVRVTVEVSVDSPTPATFYVFDPGSGAIVTATVQPGTKQQINLFEIIGPVEFLVDAKFIDPMQSLLDSKFAIAPFTCFDGTSEGKLAEPSFSTLVFVDNRMFRAIERCK